VSGGFGLHGGGEVTLRADGPCFKICDILIASFCYDFRV
jgi:hypothetical protein